MPRAPKSRHSTVARTALVAVTLVAATVGLGVRAVPASATGDPALNQLIIPNPEPGWIIEPDSTVAPFQQRLQSVEATLAGSPVTAAMKIWRGPDTGDVLEIALIQFSTDVPNPQEQVNAGADSACTGATGSSPTSTAPVPTILQSAEADCSTNGRPLTAIAWINGRVLALVLGGGSLAASDVESIATTQAAAIPTSGVSDPSSFPWTVVIIVVVVVVAVAAVFMVVVRRRRSKARSTVGTTGFGTPYPGYAPHQVQGHQPAYGVAPPYGTMPGYGQAPAGGGGYGGYPPSGGTSAPSALPYGSMAGAAPAFGAPVPGAPAPTPSPTSALPTFGSLPPLGGNLAPAPTPGPAPALAATPTGQYGGIPAPAGQYGATPAGPFGAAPAPAPVAPPVAAPAPSPFAAPAPVIGVAPAPAPAPAPAIEVPAPVGVGWHVVDGDPHRQNYWDGSAWTSSLRWDGAAWVTLPVG